MNSYINALKMLSPSFFAFIKGLRLLYAKDSFLVTSGFMKSYKIGVPCRNDGTPLPWMNYNIISFLESRLNKKIKLFEYGSGYSTLFYSRFVLSVTSIEYDKKWFQEVNTSLPTNVTLVFKELDSNGEYCRAINDTKEKFDVVIVDGRDRVNCSINSVKSLSESGVIILDDSQREKYQDAIDYLKKSGFNQLDFEGLKPTGFMMDRTSVFYKNGNCLNI